MKFQNLCIITLFIMLCGTNLVAQNTANDVEAIKTIIQSAYVDGLQNDGDMDKIDKGFHPDFNLLGIGQNNKMWKLPIEKWKERVVQKVEKGEIPKKGDDRVTIKFLNVDVTGTAAVAKIEFYIGTKLTYVDYISLYKFGEDWKIVNKIFYKF